LDDLYVTDTLTIPAAELSESFARSGGPGGQNVNKVASKVLLRWSLAESAVLSDKDREWLAERLRSRLTTAGELLVASTTGRDQAGNREDARQRLAEIVRRALARPKQRRRTRPSRGAIEHRLEEKKRRKTVKRLRRGPAPED
jgi:ribosome-associated protein